MDGEIASSNGDSPYPLPRVTIQFCTQCKWMLRAAYFAQELLSTFSTSLGEVALQPGTGGVFIVSIIAPVTSPSSTSPTPSATQHHILWDRKAEGGFPETKELKRRVRDVIDPTRDLGHVDRHHGAAAAANPSQEQPAAPAAPAPRVGHGRGGNIPLAPRPPEASNEAVRAKLEAAAQSRVEPKTEEQGGGDVGKGEVCEDCA